MTIEDEVRAVLDRRCAAIAAKNAAGSVEHFAGEVVVFDFEPPLAQPSADALDPARANEWFKTWDGPIAVELRDVVVRANGDLAFAFGFLHLSGKRSDGSTNDFWARTTTCLERRPGGWRIVHEHNSFPMLMDGSGKAATHLMP